MKDNKINILEEKLLIIIDIIERMNKRLERLEYIIKENTELPTVIT
jgi:hypothetical protein